jgi:hypothetical protein
MARRRADKPPGLLARVRWANLGRSAALLAAGLIVVTRGCGPAPEARIPAEGLPGDVAPAAPAAPRLAPPRKNSSQERIKKRLRARPQPRRAPRRRRSRPAMRVQAPTRPPAPAAAPAPTWWPQHRAPPLPEFF